METDFRFYHRRASEESARAAKALTPTARMWHEKLALEFTRRAAKAQEPAEQLMAEDAS